MTHKHSFIYLCFGVVEASSVQNLTCSSLNGAMEAHITLLWTRPKGRSPVFKLGHRQYQDNDQTTWNNLTDNCSPECAYEILKLKYYTPYQVTMQTLSCGSPSKPVSLTCTTGITGRIWTLSVTFHWQYYWSEGGGEEGYFYRAFHSLISTDATTNYSFLPRASFTTIELNNGYNYIKSYCIMAC